MISSAFHPPSIATQISLRALDSDVCLTLLMRRGWGDPIPSEVLRDQLYLAQRGWTARLPDHVFESGFRLFERQLERGVAVAALQTIAEEFLQISHGRVRAKLERYGVWQQAVVSRIAGLPIIAAARALHHAHGTYVEPSSSGALPLVTPYDTAVEDYIAREGLNESHLHLNGSTHAEVCWLRGLRAPLEETRAFRELWSKSPGKHEPRKVSELAHSTAPGFSAITLWRQLRLAALLRGALIALTSQRLDDLTELPCCAADLEQFIGRRKAEVSKHRNRFSLDEEVLWIESLVGVLLQRRLPRVDRMLHLYLLLQNRHHALLVQSEEQYGFDQFQKFTYSELRGKAEARYVDRFVAIHGSSTNTSQTRFLEGRFAPKGRWKDNEALLRTLLTDYLAYLHGGSEAKKPLLNNKPLAKVLNELEEIAKRPEGQWPQRQQLALVAHFIKKPWSSAPGLVPGSGAFRHQSLRRELDKNVAALRQTVKNHPTLRRWLRGVDGAANELHAPPEVFASAFRQCARFGLTYRTFHVGEDFPHLMTGIRHMLDAIEFLDLREGGRIGHGTAMGIDPELWLARMPSHLVVGRGERLLDLLGAWRLLKQSGETARAGQARQALDDLLPEVFTNHDVDAVLFEHAMVLRDLHIECVKLWSLDDSGANMPQREGLREEAGRVMKVAKQRKRALEILWEWQHNRDVLERSESPISMEAGAAPFAADTLLCLQQALMRVVADRRVVIETLPSSNVRISQYEGFHEHHALRWMRIDGYLKDGDPPIMVSLGSDDPGIFAADLRGELYHLYGTLRCLGLNDTEALRRVGELNERGRQYRFHNRT